jgi:proliferating cell nuclear antigen
MYKKRYKEHYYRKYIIMNEDNCVLLIRTVQISPIRNLFLSLKDILADQTVLFSKDGLRIVNFDKTHTILVNVELHASKFEQYLCKPDKIVICANALHLFKLISTMSNDDTLTMYIENCDYHDGVVSHLGLQYDNGDIKQCYSQKLRLIEPDSEELIIPDIEYSTIISLPSSDFQKNIRDLSSISDRIEIKSVGSDLIFSCEGSFASSKIYRSEMNQFMEFTQRPQDPSSVVQGIFSLKSLSQFIKCTPLCSTVEIYLSNDLPLICSYDVASLGSIKLCLSSLSLI